MDGLDIPDDVLLEIMKILDSASKLEPLFERDLGPIKSLSATNRRMRTLLLPYVFQSVFIASSVACERFLDVLESNPGIVDYIRDLGISSAIWNPQPQTGGNWGNGDMVDEEVLQKLSGLFLLGQKLGNKAKKVNIFVPTNFPSSKTVANELSRFLGHAETVAVEFLWVSSEDPLNLFIRQLHALKRLTLRARAKNNICIQPGFERIMFRDSMISESFPLGLQELCVVGGFTFANYPAWILHLRNLQVLEIRGGYLVSWELPEFVNALTTLTSCGTLRKLVIRPTNGPTCWEDKIERYEIWKTALEKILQSSETLIHLDIAGIMCEGCIIRALPRITKLQTLLLEGWWSEFASDDVAVEDKNIHADFISAVLDIPTGSLKEVQIIHDFNNLSDRDEEVERRLQENGRGLKVAFRSARSFYGGTDAHSIKATRFQA